MLGEFAEIEFIIVLNKALPIVFVFAWQGRFVCFVNYCKCMCLKVHAYPVTGIFST